MKQKSAGRKNWSRAVSDEEIILPVSGGFLVDYRAGEVTRPLDVPFRGRTLRILDSGFRWLHYAPVTEHHALTVQLNDRSEPVQIYVDICDGHGLSDAGVQFTYDLYLDVLAECEVRPGGAWQVAETEIIDMHELDAALADRKITRSQFELAWAEAKNVKARLEANDFEPLRVVQDYLKGNG